LTIREGVIVPFSSPKFNLNQRDLIKIAARYSLPIDTPYKDLSRDVKNIIWTGKDEYKGVSGFFDEIRGEFYKVHMRIMYARYRGYSRCPDCDGYRIRKDALYVKIGGLHVGQVSEMTIGHADEHFRSLELADYEQQVAGRILVEIQKRLNYLNEVGLDYLTLDRLTNSLSGGEAQRINLANALGSSLIGSLYVLDEPTIGLHPRDNRSGVEWAFGRVGHPLRLVRPIRLPHLAREHDGFDVPGGLPSPRRRCLRRRAPRRGRPCVVACMARVPRRPVRRSPRLPGGRCTP
jgi:excinuclease ABC subunit A